jgi:hypothetical protein
MKWWHWLIGLGVVGGGGYALYRALNGDPLTEEGEEMLEELESIQRQTSAEGGEEEIIDISKLDPTFLSVPIPKPGLTAAYVDPAIAAARAELEVASAKIMDALVPGWNGLAYLNTWLDARNIPLLLDGGPEGAKSWPEGSPYRESDELKEFFDDGAAIRVHPDMFVYPTSSLEKQDGPAEGDEQKIHVSPLMNQWFVWALKGGSWNLERVPISSIPPDGNEYQICELHAKGIVTKSGAEKQRQERLLTHPSGLCVSGRVLKLVRWRWKTDESGYTTKIKDHVGYLDGPKKAFRHGAVKSYFPRG